MSSQAMFIGKSFAGRYFESKVNLKIAGMFTQDPNARKAILELLECSRERTGWPVRSLGDELQQFWEDHERIEKTSTTNISVGSIP